MILDFGCGKKPFRHLFDDIECEYVGIDVYPGETVDILYDGQRIPLKDASVDLVISVSVFEHVADLDLSLREIARVLRPGGSLIGAVPFMNHIHGVPFDFHRPTRIGWEMLLKRAFGVVDSVSVEPVDSRIVCIGNIITAQLNFVLFDIARRLKAGSSTRRMKTALPLIHGGASPESASKQLKLFYVLLKLNPVNFVIGFLCFVLAKIPHARRLEGEITSGYCFSAQKTRLLDSSGCAPD